MVQFEETNAGVKKKGDWKDVAEFSKKVKNVMKNSDADASSISGFSDWRPKMKEAENDMKQKTVEKARVEPEEVETEELKRAGEKAKQAGEKVVSVENPADEVVEASNSAAKPFYSGFVQFFSKLEKIAYEKLLLRSKRWYFDSDEFAVDMKSCRDGDYQIDINVVDKDKRKYLKDELEDE